MGTDSRKVLSSGAIATESISRHLTSMFDQTAEDGVRETPPGMAHWAGTGPSGKSCRECGHWKTRGRYASAANRHAAGELKPSPCGKYESLMQQKGPPIEHWRRACRHFEPRSKVLSPVQRPKAGGN